MWCSSSPATAPTPTWCARALEDGKAVFVEKPLALSNEELDGVLATVDATGNDRLMVGFNRRFAPCCKRCANGSGERQSRPWRGTSSTPGRWPPTAGTANEELEGSRFVGEGGHFMDTLSWWIGVTRSKSPAWLQAGATTSR